MSGDRIVDLLEAADQLLRDLHSGFVTRGLDFCSLERGGATCRAHCSVDTQHLELKTQVNRFVVLRELAPSDWGALELTEAIVRRIDAALELTSLIELARRDGASICVEQSFVEDLAFEDLNLGPRNIASFYFNFGNYWVKMRLDSGGSVVVTVDGPAGSTLVPTDARKCIKAIMAGETEVVTETLHRTFTIEKSLFRMSVQARLKN